MKEQIKRNSFPDFRWKIDQYRLDKRTGPISPVKASKYYLYLSKIGAGRGAGWNE